MNNNLIFSGRLNDLNDSSEADARKNFYKLYESKNHTHDCSINKMDDIPNCEEQFSVCAKIKKSCKIMLIYFYTPSLVL